MARTPGHLAFRLALLLLLLLSANTAVFVSLYRTNLRDGMAPKMGEAIAIGVRGFRNGLRLLPPERRQEWLDQVNNGGESVKAVTAAEASQRHDQLGIFHKNMLAALRHHAGDDIEIDFQWGPPALLYVYFTVDGQIYRFLVPGSALRTKEIWPFAWLILSNVVIVLVGIGFAIWQINRPLQKSAAALLRSSNQLAEIEMPPWAPREFHIFAERFNSLARRLQAQEAERALLLAGVSHDLRAPLTRIRLQAEIIDEEAPGAGGRIVPDTDSMRHIIDQFLDYQRGSDETRTVLIDLKLTVEGIAERYHELGRNIRLNAGTSATVLADPTALERIVSNLIDNALAYGSEPIELRIDRERDSVMLEVRDHGSGIEASEIERLLRPFERLDKSRSLQGHCGLGLSIVNRLVKELGGSLTLSNHPSGGLVVLVRLPVREIPTQSH